MKKEDQIRKLIVRMINQSVEKRIGDSLEEKVCKQLTEHIGRHDVDPTLVALIKNFVPGMRQIELKKDCCGRDKKGQADKNRKKNHAEF